MITIDAYTPKMAAVDVIAIRIEKYRLLVRRERPLLHFAVSRCEEPWFAAVSGQRVEMLPAVFFGSHYQLIVSGPIEDATAGIARHIGIGALGRGAAMPNFFCRGCSGVGDPDGPRMRFIGRDKISLRRVSRFGWSAHKCNVLSVQRPYRIPVTIHGWRDILDAVCSYVVDGDESVIAAPSYKRQFFSIR